jgi:hypothetical protein
MRQTVKIPVTMPVETIHVTRKRSRSEAGATRAAQTVSAVIPGRVIRMVVAMIVTESVMQQVPTGNASVMQQVQTVTVVVTNQTVLLTIGSLRLKRRSSAMAVTEVVPMPMARVTEIMLAKQRVTVAAGMGQTASGTTTVAGTVIGMTTMTPATHPGSGSASMVEIITMMKAVQ